MLAALSTRQTPPRLRHPASWVTRYDELCGAACVATGGAACEACPRCQQLFLGLVADAKTVRLEDSLVAETPFTSFSDAEHRERERDIQFLAAGIDPVPCNDSVTTEQYST